MKLRKLSLLARVPLLLCIVGLLPTFCSAQSGNSTVPTDGKAASSGSNEFAGADSSGTGSEGTKPQQLGRSGPASGARKPRTTHEIALGVGIKVSLLGAGIEVAAPVTRRSNVRGGFNAFSYSRGFNKDGINYAGQLSFRSVEAHYDWFPFGGALPLHLSPGLLAYNGNHVSANASVPGGRQFTLGGVTFMSAASDPVAGTAKLDFNKAAPTLLLGWGNPVPRSHRRLSINFELGVAYQGSPNASLNLKGTACDPSGIICHSVGTDPTIQSDIQSEQKKINHNLSPFAFYPLISLGFSYKF